MMIHPAGVCERSIFGRTGPEKRRICSRGSPAAGATIVTDTWPEACMERMISLLRDWINASETGRDSRTSRAAEHKTVTRSTSREVRWLRWSRTSCRSTAFCWIRRRVRPCLTGLCYLNRLGCIGRTRTHSHGTCSR